MDERLLALDQATKVEDERLLVEFGPLLDGKCPQRVEDTCIVLPQTAPDSLARRLQGASEDASTDILTDVGYLVEEAQFTFRGCPRTLPAYPSSRG